jgi:hypothetical protein
VLAKGDSTGIDDSADDLGSQGSNTRAWHAFAQGGHLQHDAILREMQRERYLHDQMNSLSPEAAKNVAADARVTTLSLSHSTQSQPATDVDEPFPLIPSVATPGLSLEGPGPVSPSYAAALPCKAKVSHRDRFKRAVPSTASIATHIASPPAISTKSLTPPPAGNIEASCLHPAQQPLRQIQNPHSLARLLSFDLVHDTAPSKEMDGDEEFLIDLN